jgi:hypothetical protein
MRHNKKNTKKAIQRKLTTRKRWKNNRSLPRRTQYKTHKSYKQMRGGLVRTTIVKELLNPSNNDPILVQKEPNNSKLIGALIIKPYNDLKTEYKYIVLPDIPSSSVRLNEKQIDGIVTLADLYEKAYAPNNGSNELVDNNPPLLLNVKALPPNEFKKWLKYILEGNVYKKIAPVYTDNEFNKFKSLAVSLKKLKDRISGQPPNPSPLNPSQSPPQPLQPRYKTYEVFNIGGLKTFLSTFVSPSSILCEMCCVISLPRGNPKIWKWDELTALEKKTISPNQYCANRQYKRLIVSQIPSAPPAPLNKINVARLTYQMQTLTEYITVNNKFMKIVNVMLGNMNTNINTIKALFEETAQFKQIIIEAQTGFYKYYEFKIRRSSIVNPDNKRDTIPVIICTLSGFDEDGICDFEFVYVCVVPQQPNTSKAEEFVTKVKGKTHSILGAEMLRIQSLLGGQTWTTPTTAEKTQNQYYDMISLTFDKSRNTADIGDDKSNEPLHVHDNKLNEPLHVLDPTETWEKPCTLILKYERNTETEKSEPVWKAAKATSIQSAAFDRVADYLRTNNITKLDDTMIRVYKITNSDPPPQQITVFVEVKKLDADGVLLQVEYQALGGARYEVYNNATSARAAAQLNKAHYNWVTDTGMLS